MALKPIRVVPTELPQARLYLEDVEEITQLLQENLPPDAAGQPPRIKYKLTEETADSIDDLKEKGTVSKSLEISAASCDVTIGRISSIRCYGLNDVIPRTLHSSVTQIFNRRKRRFFNFLQPDGIRFALFILPLLSFFIFVKLTAPYNEHFHYLRLTGAFLIVIPPFLLWFFYFELAGSRVCLFYHQEKSKTARADIKRYLEWLGFTVFGIVIAWLWHKFLG
jgi:hypothetical protein